MPNVPLVVPIVLLSLLAEQAYASDAGKKSDINVMTTTINSTTNIEPDYARHEPMHCQSNEEIVFNCRIGKKALSICAFPKNGRYKILEYRYGAVGKVEMRYTASHSNKSRFYSFTEPLNPKASVSGIWFSQGNIDYVISECQGGDCPSESGLVVLKNSKPNSRGKPIFTKACGSNIYGEKNAPFLGHAFINPNIVEFGPDNPKSNTELVLDDESRIGVDDLLTLYPRSGQLY